MILLSTVLGSNPHHGGGGGVGGHIFKSSTSIKKQLGRPVLSECLLYDRWLGGRLVGDRPTGILSYSGPPEGSHRNTHDPTRNLRLTAFTSYNRFCRAAVRCSDRSNVVTCDLQSIPHPRQTDVGARHVPAGVRSIVSRNILRKGTLLTRNIRRNGEYPVDSCTLVLIG